jgi:hypothetical protein
LVALFYKGDKRKFLKTVQKGIRLKYLQENEGQDKSGCRQILKEKETVERHI